MSKFFIFFLLLYILRNPLLALIVLLVVLYFIDRRWIGLLPSLAKPFRRSRQIRKLRDELALSPHHTSLKHELARLLMERDRYADAAVLLEQVKERVEDSDDVSAELGICYLQLGRREEAEHWLANVLARNPKVKYGEPLLRLGSYYAKTEPERAIEYLRQFQAIQTSSCQGYYRLGQIYETLGRKQEAAAAYREGQEIYRALPKYKRRSERRWYILSKLKTFR